MLSTLLLTLATAPPAIAQSNGASVAVRVGPQLMAGGGEILDGGWSFGLAASRSVGPRFLSVSAEVRFNRLETDEDPGGRATNGLLTLLAGVEAELGQGRLRPWGSVSGGLLGNRSTVRSRAGTDRHTEWAPALGVAAGVRTRLRDGLHLDLSGEVLRAAELGVARYDGDPGGAREIRVEPALLSLQATLRLYLD